MPPEDNPSSAPTLPSRRRALFPWVWIGLLAACRLILQCLGITQDYKSIATMVTLTLAVMGVALWYAVRGRGPLPLRWAVGIAPFAFLFAIFSLYELQHGGDGWIVGLHRRGTAKPDEQLGDQLSSHAVQASDTKQGISDWLPPSLQDYPRFLGQEMNAEVAGVSLEADWKSHPLVELWRQPIGAGWSTFAIVGDYAFTQEQRGNAELVVCYRASTGEVLWSHTDAVRFDPEDFRGEMGRTGPRATPTVSGDRVYTQGATGIVSCLDARTGAVLWRSNTAREFGVVVTMWGKSGSPLVLEEAGLVIVGVGVRLESTPEKNYGTSLVAFDADTGEVRWQAGWRQTSYASPVPAEIAGVSVILQVNEDALTAHAADDGRVLWEHPWPGKSDSNANCSQPVSLADDRVLLTKGYGTGASLIQVEKNASGDFSTKPLWSPAIKPVLETKFSNIVRRDGHAFGLDGTILQCVEIATGKILWKKRRRPSFGFGQIMLVGDHLLVLSETGELVLIDASTEAYRECSSLQALSEDETCWNNPSLAGDLLIVRNAVEAVAYRLTLQE